MHRHIAGRCKNRNMATISEEALRSSASSPLRARRLRCVLTQRLRVLRYLKRHEDKNPCGLDPPIAQQDQVGTAIGYVEAAITTLARISGEVQTPQDALSYLP